MRESRIKRAWIPNQVGDDSGCAFEDDSGDVIPAKAGIQEVFLSSNIREKNNIDSPLLISGITENENNKEKERKHWIPNRVGDDSYYGSSIKDFEDDSEFAFEDDS